MGRERIEKDDVRFNEKLNDRFIALENSQGSGGKFKVLDHVPTAKDRIRGGAFVMYRSGGTEKLYFNFGDLTTPIFRKISLIV